MQPSDDHDWFLLFMLNEMPKLSMMYFKAKMLARTQTPHNVQAPNIILFGSQLLFWSHLFKGLQPFLSSHLAISWGWLLNRGLTVCYQVRLAWFVMWCCFHLVVHICFMTYPQNDAINNNIIICGIYIVLYPDAQGTKPSLVLVLSVIEQILF